MSYYYNKIRHEVNLFKYYFLPSLLITPLLLKALKFQNQLPYWFFFSSKILNLIYWCKNLFLKVYILKLLSLYYFLQHVHTILLLYHDKQKCTSYQNNIYIHSCRYNLTLRQQYHYDIITSTKVFIIKNLILW